MGSRNVRGVRAGIPQGVVLGRSGTSRRPGAATYISVNDLGKSLVAGGGLAPGSGGSSAVSPASKSTSMPIADGDLIANISGASAIPIANTLTGLISHLGLLLISVSLIEVHQHAEPVSGDTVTLTANVRRCIINPAAGIAALTVVLPPNPINGQVTGISSTQAIAALTVNAGTGGAAIVGAPTALTAGQAFTMLYRLTDNSWFISA